MSHNGQWIVSGARDQSVRIWDAHNAVTQCVIEHMSPVLVLVFPATTVTYFKDNGFRFPLVLSLLLVIGTGNPRVIRDLPRPIPEKTRTLA